MIKQIGLRHIKKTRDVFLAESIMQANAQDKKMKGM